MTHPSGRRACAMREGVRRLWGLRGGYTVYPSRMAMVRHSVSLLAGISILAIGLVASPLTIGIPPLHVGINAALAQGGHGGGGGAGLWVGGGPGARQGMGMQQSPMSPSPMQQGSMQQGPMQQGPMQEGPM